MKRILLLGGSRFLLPVIETAKKMGCYVMTCDYLPNNIAHKYSDEYINKSIIDKDAILEVAKAKHIDGIMSFACDPGVVTAAYVAEKLGLPSVANYDTVCILQNKDRFRSFLKENGFNTPWSYSYSSMEEVMANSNSFIFPMIIKPVDSAGSKGVSKVTCYEELKKACCYALKNSFSKRIIVEEFLESKSDPTDCDCFSVDGEMVSINFSRQKFDKKANNPYTPSGFVFPSSMCESAKMELKREIQRLCSTLELKTSIYNVEARIAKDDKVYLMEVSPRGGGNRLAEMIRLSTGVDLIEASVRAALGMRIEEIKCSDCDSEACFYEYILHTNRSGLFNSIRISSYVERYVIEKDIWIKKGDRVNLFSGANDTFGTLVFKFPSGINAEEIVDNIDKYIEVVVDE